MTVQTIETKREPMGSKVAKWLVRQGFREFRVYNHEPEDRDCCQWIRWQRFGTLWRWNRERNCVSYRKLSHEAGYYEYESTMMYVGLYVPTSETAVESMKSDSSRVVHIRLNHSFESPYLPSKKVRAVPTRLQKFVEAYGMKCVRLNAFDFVIFA
jgi:hypothetical protein